MYIQFQAVKKYYQDVTNTNLQMNTIKNINDYNVLNDGSPNVTEFEPDTQRYEKYI